jgi:phosphatidate cytidylyltransferase
MADSQKAFLTRVVSALLGAAIIFGGAFYGGPRGVQIICFLAMALAIREYTRMIFNHTQMPAGAAWFYRVLAVVLYLEMFLHIWPLHADTLALRFGIGVVVFIFGALWTARGRVSNENLLTAVTAGSFGLVYCMLFPLFGSALSFLSDGVSWFFFMLVTVFFGDTFAYFFGRWFGKRKLMVEVSPNKTWEGALGGLVGSAFGGTVFGLAMFQDVAWYKFAAFCLVCGAVEQSGDLLMSLVKRVAHVKDSGSIMPGHGGILDRLDGIFIACPLVYAFALYVRPF